VAIYIRQSLKRKIKRKQHEEPTEMLSSEFKILNSGKVRPCNAI
jgi:gluconate kinase